MKVFFSNFYNKPDSNINSKADNNTSEAHFQLKIDDVLIGDLSFNNSIWTFIYSNQFKNQTKYHRLVGFPDLDKEYKSDVLWPFFKTRIPGLRQPSVLEILERKKISRSDESKLLKLFGKFSPTNPFILESI